MHFYNLTTTDRMCSAFFFFRDFLLWDGTSRLFGASSQQWGEEE